MAKRNEKMTIMRCKSTTKGHLPNKKELEMNTNGVVVFNELSHNASIATAYYEKEDV